MIKQITFIGLGVMGEAMCGNLARRGDWPVFAYDLKSEPLERLAAEGVFPPPTSMDEAAASDFVITCLPGGDHVRSLVLDGRLLDKIKPGAVLVDMSTSQPALMREIAEAARAKNIDFADAPIARTRQAAADGTLAIMVGASDADLRAYPAGDGDHRLRRHALWRGWNGPDRQDHEQHGPVPKPSPP